MPALPDGHDSERVRSQAKSVVTLQQFTWFQPVHRAAIGALGHAGVRHIEIHHGVGVPQLHILQGARATHTALGIDVCQKEFKFCIAHVGIIVGRFQMAVNQCAYLGLR